MLLYFLDLLLELTNLDVLKFKLLLDVGLFVTHAQVHLFWTLSWTESIVSGPLSIVYEAD
jgi:hypothetical protein